MDLEDPGSTEVTIVPRSSPAVFVLADPQPSVLTAPLTAHFTAVSAQSTLQQLHSVQRSPSTASAPTDSLSVPLYRWTTASAHKRQKRQLHSTVDLSSSSTPPAKQPRVELVLAYHTASSVSLPLLSFAATQLRAPVLLALVDGGQSVTVLRLQDGIAPLPSHGQQKKSKAPQAKAATSHTAAVVS